MKLSRIAAAVTTAALAPVVLIASPAFAAGQDAATSTPPAGPTAPDQAGADQTPAGQADGDQAERDRTAILAIIADPMASDYMKTAGHKAIAEGPAAMRKFIDTDQHRIRIDDYRVLVTRLLIGAGPGLKAGIKDVFQTGGSDLAKLRHFYDVTQHELRDDDNKVEIARLTRTGGFEVREEATKALLGTPADRIAFLKTGQYLAQASDDRVELARIDEGWDGEHLSKAISKLLRGPATPAELRHFLEVTQYEIRDQDNRIAVARTIAKGGPELIKAGLAALNGTPAERVEFLKTGQHEARAKDKKAQEEKDKQGQGQGNSGTGSGSGTGTGTGTGNTAVTPQGGSGAALATTGAGDASMIAGGAGTALAAGAGLLLAARMRRAASASAL